VPLGGIVLLDLSMPGIGGRETLNLIKADRARCDRSPW
jgi:CheY-like chemotaxis protein